MCPVLGDYGCWLRGARGPAGRWSGLEPPFPLSFSQQNAVVLLFNLLPPLNLLSFFFAAHRLLWFLFFFFNLLSSSPHIFSPFPLLCLGSASAVVAQGWSRTGVLLPHGGNVAFLSKERPCSTLPCFWGKRASLLFSPFQFPLTATWIWC